MEDITEILGNKEQHADRTGAGSVAGEPLVIPVIEEKIKIDKKTVETGKVRVSKKVSEEEEIIDVPVLREEVVVERIPVHQFVETVPQIRYQGETMIVPVLREVVVVEKRIELIEELHITKQTVQTQVSQQVTLRKEEVVVERLPGENNVSSSHL